MFMVFVQRLFKHELWSLSSSTSELQRGRGSLVIQSNDPVKIKSPVSGTGQGLSPLIPHVLP